MIDTIKNFIRLNNPRYWRAMYTDMVDLALSREREANALRRERDAANRALEMERAAHQVTAKRLDDTLYEQEARKWEQRGDDLCSPS